MNRIIRFLSMVVALMGCAMFGGTALTGANHAERVDANSPVSHTPTNEPDTHTATGSSGQVNTDEQSATEPLFEDAEDPDMPKGRRGGMGGINEKTYLRLRDEYIARRRGMEPGRPFDPEARGRAVKQIEMQEALFAESNQRLRLKKTNNAFESNFSAPSWVAIGPAPLPNGVGNNPVSGRVTSIVVDSTNSNKVYLGTAQGGVWRSLDGGKTWASIFDDAESLSVGALALAPSNPTILYVGTGESNRSGDSFFGVGVYRIDNVDTAATLVGPINPSFSFNTSGGNVTTSTFSGRSISQIVVHPTQPGTIFVGTSSGVAGSGANSLSNLIPPIALLGVYRSTNADGPLASITFQKLAVATAGGSLDVPGTGNRRITDLVMEPGNPDNLLVGVFGSPSVNDGGIFRTTNALAVAPVFTQVLQISIDRIHFAIHKDPTSGVVKVLAATGETPSTASCSSTTQKGILRQSVDGGVTWPNTTATASTGGILTGAGGFCGGQCWYNITVAIDPKNSNNIYLGGNVRSTCSGLMKRSSDGVNFFNDYTGLHADSHALYFDPLTTPSTIFTGNDGGVWKGSVPTVPASTNPASNTAWVNLNSAPLNTMQFESVAVHPTDQFMSIGGTQDNGTEVQQTVTGNWINAEGGDGGYALIDQSATDTTNVTMYHTFFNQTGTQIGFDRIINTSCLLLKNSWPTRGDFGIADQSSLACDGTPDVLNNGISRTDVVLFYAPIALGPGTPNTVYFGSNRLYRSTDRGDHMTVVSQDPILVTSPITTIAISPQDDAYRLVGMQNGQIWATSTASSTLVDVTSGSFPANPNGSLANRFVGRAVIDPNNKNVAYVAFSFFARAGQGIWKITNLGAAAGAESVAPNWIPAGSGIPSVPINALVVDPINSNNLYAGTDIGVYYSTDAGVSWNPYGTGLPRSAVFDLAIQPTSRILRAATHGRGIWETPLITPGPSTVELNATTSITESQTSKSVVITRSGDTSFPATVNYATSDTAAATNCNVVSGIASSRCDYIATVGTVNFAANENSKDILIPIVDDAYLEGNETFTITLGNPTGSNVTLGTASVPITITDNELVSSGTNPIGEANYFVRQHYIDFLNREPDAPGHAFWSDQIVSCGTDRECINVRSINVSGSFFLSIEFKETGYLVYRVHKVAYGEGSGTYKDSQGNPQPIQVPIIRLQEFLPDTRRIGEGVQVTVGDWKTQLEINKQAYMEDFERRLPFTNRYPATMTAVDFVNALSTNAGPGVLSPIEVNDLVNDLNSGRKTRAQVLRAVAQDPDLFDAEFNKAFVLMQYFGYLRRNPNDLQDTDYSGYNFWLVKLNQFNGDFVRAEMVKAFLESIEYRRRFGP
ncbi:MAG: Calx-beta domain-containing protein [Pyrinomonadaceae bacterium]